MAKVLTFKYPDCGFEVDVPMLDRQGKTALMRQVGPVVSRMHRRDCEVCRKRRQDRFREQNQKLAPRPFTVTFRSP
jgi:hypothetical protein